jgi:NADPH:quinone reductase
MTPSIPETLRAAAIDHFGGPEVLYLHALPVPRPEAGEVLIRLDAAGIGVWDPEVRDGSLVSGETAFPYVIGSDGAGTIAALGEGVTRFAVGDRVYGYSMEGGFYAEYVTASQDNVARVPPGVKTDEAGALGADGVTAFRGLVDHLRLQPGDKLMVFGASGGIGHIAVQLAKRLGARVLAVASGSDGVELDRRIGADAAVDGKHDDIVEAARQFAPEGLDAALVLVDGEGLREALKLIKKRGRLAYPNGVEPEPRAPQGVRSMAYDGVPSRDTFERLNRLIGDRPFHVELGRVYRLDEAALAHLEIGRHHLGKLAFRMRASV